MCYASMEMSAPIRFGTEGFRGVIAREFTFATLHRLAEAYGRHLLERGGGLVVVGHDTRFLADAFARALSGHLAGMGLKVVLLKGPVPTPSSPSPCATLRRRAGPCSPRATTRPSTSG